MWLTRQPREAAGLTASLEIPAGKLDVAGEPPLETAKRELAEEIGKRARVWRGDRWRSTPVPGFSDERVWLVPGAPSSRDDHPSRRAGRGRADRDRSLAARRARRGDRRVRGLEVADRAAVAGRSRASAARSEAPKRTAARNRRTAARPGEYGRWRPRPPPRAAPSDRADARFPGVSRARARPVAQHARGVPLRSAAVRRVPRPARSSIRSQVSQPTCAAFISELADGRGGKPPVAPATLQRKIACLRSFYRHLRREQIIDHDPTAELRPPRSRGRLPKVLSRDEVRPPARAAEGHVAGGAPRPRAAGDDVRLRPARLGGDRARAVGPRPRGGDPARPRQGLEGADRADRSQGDRDARRPTSSAGRPRLVGLARRAARVRQPARRRALPPGALQDRPAPRPHGRARAADEPAHAAPHVRHPPAGRRLRPALAAGDARPRRHRHDADLHAPILRPPARRLLRRSSARADQPQRVARVPAWASRTSTTRSRADYDLGHLRSRWTMLGEAAGRVDRRRATGSSSRPAAGRRPPTSTGARRRSSTCWRDAGSPGIAARRRRSAPATASSTGRARGAHTVHAVDGTRRARVRHPVEYDESLALPAARGSRVLGGRAVESVPASGREPPIQFTREAEHRRARAAVGAR